LGNRGSIFIHNNNTIKDNNNNNDKVMSKRQVEIDLPAKVWKIIETQFKLNDESDSEILSKIIKNHLASNGYYPDTDSLQQGNGLKDIVDLHQDMIITLLDLLERKGLITHKEWNQLMQEQIRKDTESFN
jgi:hypothetical protein